jgi:hypothetical protein
VNPLSSVPYFCRGGWRGYLPLHEKYTCPCLQSLCVTLAFREVVLFPAQLTVRRNTKTCRFYKGARWFSSNLEMKTPTPSPLRSWLYPVFLNQPRVVDTLFATSFPCKIV